MINRVLLAGRIVQGPEIHDSPGAARAAVMSLLLTHPHWGSDELETTRIDVLVFGQRRIEVATQYLEDGRDLLVEGRLSRRDGRTVVTVEQFHFMMRDVATRYFWNEAIVEGAAAA